MKTFKMTTSPHRLIFLLIVLGAQGNEWVVNYTQQNLCALNGSKVFINGTTTHSVGLNVTMAFWSMNLFPGKETDLHNVSAYSARVEYLGDEQRHFSLILSDVKKTDEHRYYFKIIANSTNQSWVAETGVNLTVTDLQVIAPAEVTEGQSAVLTCKTTCSLTDPTFIWYKNSRDLTTNTIKRNKVHLQPVSSEDAGSYSCAVRGYEHLSSPAHTLRVRYPPKNISVSISPSSEIVEGSSVTLTCSGDANPPATCKWYKETILVEKGKIYSITNISIETRGEYKCKCSNEIRHKYSTGIILNVLYPPRNVMYTVSVYISSAGDIVEDSSVTLTCSSDANPPVENYTWFKVNESSSVGSGQSYRALQSGQYYCEAQNKHGSERSAAVSVTLHVSGTSVIVYVIVGVGLLGLAALNSALFWLRWLDNIILKCVDGTAVMGCTTGLDKAAYKMEMASLVTWCEDNNLSLNMNKTMDMRVDTEKEKGPHRPLFIRELEVKRRIAMDIVGPLEKSSAGHQYILVVSDYATRYPEAFPLRSTTTSKIINALVQQFSRVGIPEEILTNQGTNFTSRLMKLLHQQLGITAIKTSPYHPQTDGLVEHFNQTLKNILRKFVSDTGRDWDKWLPFLLFAYREVPQASTDSSPFQLLYGWQVQGPLDLLQKSWEAASSQRMDKGLIQHEIHLLDPTPSRQRPYRVPERLVAPLKAEIEMMLELGVIEPSKSEEMPIAFLSRKLLPRETRYSTVEKEGLAIKWALESLRYYLLGRKFLLETDHRALTWIHTIKDHNSRVTKWYLSLQPYQFKIQHQPGPQNKIADYLSRYPVIAPAEVTEGQSAVLTCKTTCSLTDPTFIWYKNSRGLTTNTIKSNKVHLQSVSSEDAGSYSCAVRGYEHLPSPAHTLRVRYSPKNVSVSISPSGEIVEGSSVTLTCSSDAKPPVENYEWFKEITLVGKGKTFTISKISSEDSGEYKCKCSNKVGHQDSSSVTLNVLYIPKKVSVSISISFNILVGSSVTLTCSSDANPPVENYTWFKVNESSAVGSGQSYRALQSGQYYCEAQNKNGSERSAAVSVRNGVSGSVILYVAVGFGCLGLGAFLFALFSMRCRRQKKKADSGDFQNAGPSAKDDTYAALDLTAQSSNDVYHTLQISHPSPPADTPTSSDC
ncbi:uncharacterized protein LOC128507002 [Clarias gariepinus]|uniref:uncharacterized protein LOC128507002 n=1 Tax=Clarias gariepinus TaxID=13013 RepID=UPI00234C5ED0|nr:uncharacterized protein LOC128507002 [Clarias gariepinus]